MVVPPGVGRLGTPPQRGLVHDVVVVERGQVGQLHDAGGGDHVVGVGVGPGLRGEQHQERAEPLPTGLHEVARCLGDEAGAAAHVAGQGVLDGQHARLETLRQGSVGDRQCQPSCAHLMNSPARAARSSTGPGITPSARVAAALTAMTVAVRTDGWVTLGASAPGLGEEHQHDHPHVEERGDDAAQDGGDDDRPGAGGERHREDRPLADEPGRQRDAGHREQEEREDAGHHRRLLAEPRPPRQVGLLAAGVADHGDDGEGTERREAVADEVEQDRLQRRDLADRQVGAALDAEHTGQQEARVGHRGVGEHPLDVGLGDREDRADDHGEDGDHPHHRLPAPAVGAEGDVEETHQGAEGRHLRRRRHEGGDGGGGALVGVGRPALERRGTDLEEQADGQHAHADQQQRAVAEVVADRLVDGGELHRAGEAVDQGDAVEEEAGREGAEQEVLERRLLAQQPPAPGQPAEQVERQREDLERDEHRQQVVGRREQHHAADGEHQERVDLGVVEAGGRGLALGLGARQRSGLTGERGDPALEVPLGEEQHSPDREDQDQAPQEDGGTVDDDRAAGGDQPARLTVPEHLQPVGDHDGADQGGDQAGDGQDALREVATPARQERLDQHAGAGDTEHQEQRPQLGVLDLRLDELVHWWPSSAESCPPVGTTGASSVTPTCWSVSSTLGLITSSSGIG